MNNLSRQLVKIAAYLDGLTECPNCRKNFEAIHTRSRRNPGKCKYLNLEKYISNKKETNVINCPYCGETFKYNKKVRRRISI